jgi:nitrate reductase NapD
MTVRADANICGVLVRVRPGRVDAATEALNAIPGVEVHRVLGRGQLVVTVEDTAELRATDALIRLHNVDGVLAASLVYHRIESEKPLSQGVQP